MAQVVGVVWYHDGYGIASTICQEVLGPLPRYSLADGHAFPRASLWLKEIEGLHGEGRRVETRRGRRIGMQE
jgi:hypothetical protein